MCGINGILTWDDSPIELGRIRQMNEAIAHRGPDSDGVHEEERLALGFRRLAMIDLDTGRQPLHNEDKTCWLVFNGEIYNYRELLAELTARGHTFYTKTDSEVIVHAYEEWGKACVQKFRGMFAFAIWDRKRQELFCARDHFGMKPFYYTKQKNAFVFSSEIKALLASGAVNASVDSTAFLNYLTFQYPPQEMTMFQNIHKLLPAHCMTVAANGECHIERYWQLSFEPEENRSLDSFIEELREQFRESVDLHLQCDVPYGTFLSSGIDSTAVTSLVAAKSAKPLSSFSVGFADYPVNEVEYAKQTADEIGINFFSRALTADDYLAAIPHVVRHMDEPMADPSAIPLYYLMQLAREHVTMALSGEGADELFGGYPIYGETRAIAPFRHVPAGLKKVIRGFAAKLPVGMYGRSYLLRANTPLNERFVGNAFLFDEAEKRRIVSLSGETLAHYRTPFDVVAGAYEESKTWDPLSQMQYTDIMHWMPGNILLKADKMSMAHSLEVRMPILDVKIAEFAAKIPAHMRVTKHTTKYVLREAMKGIIPDSVVNRPKLGFPVPLKKWLTGPLYEPVRDVLASTTIATWIDQSAATRLLDEHKAGKFDHSRKIWALYIFSRWHEQFVQSVKTNKNAVPVGETKPQREQVDLSFDKDDSQSAAPM